MSIYTKDARFYVYFIVFAGIIIIAVCGLIVGVICRRDCCGIKTKMCRTRRPLPTDQVRPSEEVPLNKITNNQ
jgi:hypothetical protein